jgi:hypothetical protein
MPYIFATTLLLYKLDTLSLKQKNLPVLDITATHLCLHLSTHAEKETRYIQYGLKCLESQIRQQLTKNKRQICIGQRPFDSRLYLDISRSFK